MRLITAQLLTVILLQVTVFSSPLQRRQLQVLDTVTELVSDDGSESSESTSESSTSSSTSRSSSRTVSSPEVEEESFKTRRIGGERGTEEVTRTTTTTVTEEDDDDNKKGKKKDGEDEDGEDGSNKKNKKKKKKSGSKGDDDDEDEGPYYGRIYNRYRYALVNHSVRTNQFNLFGSSVNDNVDGIN